MALSLLLPFSARAVEQYKISNLNNINLPSTWNGIGDLSDNDDVCIYTTDQVSDGYALKAYTSRSAFEMTVSSQVLNFDVYYKGSGGTSGNYAKLGYNSFRNFTGADQSSQTCSSGSALNGNLKIVVTEANLGAAKTGNYSATLYLVVGPAT